MVQVQIRPTESKDSEWINSLIKDQWGSQIIVTRGKLHRTHQLPGFIATISEQKAGLITYSLHNNECEIITLDSLSEGKGIGTKLIEKVIHLAKTKRCHRVWLIATNDNTDALAFYQKRGFIISAFYPNAIEQSRKIKPEIPPVGAHDIPIRDEIELEFIL